MNTRQPLVQYDDIPPVLCVSTSHNGKRFVVGTTSGLRVFRTDNCLTTYKPKLALGSENYLDDAGIAVAAIFDDRYLVFVGGGRFPHGGAKATTALCFWDTVLGKQTTKLDMREPVLGLRIGRTDLVVILRERTVILQYQRVEPAKEDAPRPDLSQSHTSAQTESPDTPTAESHFQGGEIVDHHVQCKVPNSVRAIVATSSNDFALGSLCDSLLALPAQTMGQVQLLPITGGSKRVLRAHTSPLRALCLSKDGTLLATCSEQGTLIRVFETSRGDQVAEFRRGVDKAIIYDLAFSANNKWLASTSDKGTLHVYDLAPTSSTIPTETAPSGTHSRNRASKGSLSYATHRLSYGTDVDSLSGASYARSHPTSLASGPHSNNVHQNPGSAQEYYGLKPPPQAATPHITSPGISALAALKSSPFAPKALKDVRSRFKASFFLGEEASHWQGGTSQSWTTMPNGTRKKVANPVPPLPHDPSGKPPKGHILFAPKDKGKPDVNEDEEVIYVIGGGADARWEKFRLIRSTEGDDWVLLSEGYRRYLTKQFV